MAYKSNPYLGRTSERTTSDHDFVRLFSPKILEKFPGGAFEGAVHIFRSPPGGGKTTLLRAFTPTVIRAFWNQRKNPEMLESFQRLVAFEVLDETEGPRSLGVLLSCASGYADLPPGAPFVQAGLFRALLDCRVVLRTLRNLAALLGASSNEQLTSVKLEYSDSVLDIKSIPLTTDAAELIAWAEQRERAVYTQLDAMDPLSDGEMPAHVRFESVIWLQGVNFIRDGKVIVPHRILMIDDLHKLRKKQRDLLIEELVELRPNIPVWLAERSIALGPELLSQGAREGRDLHQYDLEDLWSPGRGQSQFVAYAQNILERRLSTQSSIPHGNFTQYLRSELQDDEMGTEIADGMGKFQSLVAPFRNEISYKEWLSRADDLLEREKSVSSLLELYSTLILIARNEGKRQMTLELAPLSAEELDVRDSSQVQGAAEIFIREYHKIAYYYGMDRFCAMATNNVEELLSLAATLYDSLQAKQVLRRDLLLSPQEQEKALLEAAKKKRDFIPKAHSEGARAQKLLDSIGIFCRDKTFLANAPYAPGVTGVRLSATEYNKLSSTRSPSIEQLAILKNVLSECVAENLLITRHSVASTSRESGTVFYLNRTLCAHFGLPLQMGGWQDVKVQDLVLWMQQGRQPTKKTLLEMS